MTTPAPINLETMTAVGHQIDQQEANITAQKIEVLNRAAAKLADLEEETTFMQGQRDLVLVELKRAEENIIRITAMRDKCKAVADDFEITIQANLTAIDSLRKANIRTT